MGMPILVAIFLFIILLVVLTAVVRMSPFISFLLVTITAGFILGMPPGEIVRSMQKGIGDMLGSVIIKEKIELVKDQMGQINSDNMVTEETLKQAYTLTRLVNHQQGFMLIKSASDNFKWNLNLSELARIWTNGCIIRSHLMEKLTLVLHDQNNHFSNLEIQNQISELKPALKKCCIGALNFNLAFPCHLAALDYLNTLQNDYASANIIQAQRDFFGAHRYRRKDDASGKTYHTEWE